MSQNSLNITASVILSAGLFIINWVVRGHKGYTYSAAADFALALMGFDLAAAITATSFNSMFRNAVFDANRVVVFVCLFVITMPLWIGILLRMENYVVSKYEGTPADYRSGAAMTVAILGQIIAGVLLCIHVVMFWVA